MDQEQETFKYPDHRIWILTSKVSGFSIYASSFKSHVLNAVKHLVPNYSLVLYSVTQDQKVWNIVNSNGEANYFLTLMPVSD